MGAGAPHAVKREEQEEQITRDVSRTSYKIGETTFGCAMGEHVDGNIREKMVSSLGINLEGGQRKQFSGMFGSTLLTGQGERGVCGGGAYSS